VIFSRRAIQRLLNELKPILRRRAYADLMRKLNYPTEARLPAMWEVAVLAALSRLGTLEHEQKQANGKRPDISFRAPHCTSFVADITTVSDRGVDQRNPYGAMAAIIEREKAALGLGVGGVRLEVFEKPEVMREGKRRKLRLPPHDQIEDYVRRTIIPVLEAQQSSGQWPLVHVVDDDEAGFRLTISDGPYSGGSFGAYNIPTIATQNPLFYKLEEKASDQLSAVAGPAGIIVCDGDCGSLTSERGHSNVSTDDIVRTFLRKHHHIAFVLLLTVKSEWQSGLSRKEVLSIKHMLWHRDTIAGLPQLADELVKGLPVPVNSAANGSLRALEPGYGRGRGDYSMAPGRSIRIGARHLLEVLAGRRTVEDFNRNFHFRGLDEPQDGRRFVNPFEQALAEGKLPVRIEVKPIDENGNDTFLEIEFGHPDPAVSPFR